MPFITKENRKKVDTLTDDEVKDILFTYKSVEAGFSVGDKCYYFYNKMMKKWKKERRWTTAHNIYQVLFSQIDNMRVSIDTKCAYSLAWQVFFAKHVMKYEDEKCLQNGDITGDQREGK